MVMLTIGHAGIYHYSVQFTVEWIMNWTINYRSRKLIFSSWQKWPGDKKEEGNVVLLNYILLHLLHWRFWSSEAKKLYTMLITYYTIEVTTKILYMIIQHQDVLFQKDSHLLNNMNHLWQEDWWWPFILNWSSLLMPYQDQCLLNCNIFMIFDGLNICGGWRQL